MKFILHGYALIFTAIMYMTTTGCKDIVAPLELELPQQDTMVNQFDSFLELLWRVPINQDTSGSFFVLGLQLYRNKIMFIKGFDGPEDIVHCRDQSTGGVLWTWSDPENIQDGASIPTTQVWEDMLVLCSWHQIDVLNINSGVSIWKSSLRKQGGCGNPRIALFNGYIYHTHSDCSMVFDSLSHLVRAHITEGRWDTLLTLAKADNYSSRIESLNLWMNPQGDSILIFQDRRINLLAPYAVGRIDLHAYNLTQRRHEWQADNIDPSGNSNVWATYIYHNKVYFLGSRTVYCFDAQQGKLLWQRYFGGGGFEHFMGSASQMVVNGQLWVKPANRRLVALDPNSGAIFWDTNEGGASPYPMVYYKGHIFYGSSGDGGVFVHRASDGKLVQRIRRPFSSTLSSDIAINQEAGLLFWSDGYFLRCYKIKL
ncbi:MAG TPA: PQQ-binding-like beta-propeller repeat protein [Saprospiraceae bacterium]|nr:PQQ-binding-like beta-propeller repeat protein [Saprospiraceae bacterium]HMP14945.1 PQQ-binding-like beta-propeller repeat protein [Saprospiraceae bacterium]